MRDFIDREVALDMLAEHEKSQGHNYSLFRDVVSECAEVVRDVPSAFEWHPASELPRKGEQVLVYAMNTHYVCGKFDEVWTGNTWEDIWVTFDGYHGMAKIKEPIAWMPLPKEAPL